MPYPFPSQSKAEWLAKVTTDLRGRPLSGLDFTVADRTFSPFHHADDQPHPYPPLPGRTNEQLGIGSVIRIAGTDYGAANRAALTALQRGANEIWFEHPADRAAGADAGVALTQGFLMELLNVYHHYPTENRLVTAGQPNEYHPQYGAPGDLAAALAAVLREHERALESSSGAGGRRTPVFWVSPDDDYLTSIARFRSLRAVWGRLAEVYPGLPAAVRVNARVAAAGDGGPHTAKIKATTRAAAAICGGADAVFVDGFTQDPAGDANPAALVAEETRLGLNIAHILTLESHLDRVRDPAAGSYYLESLTDHLAARLWDDLRRHHQTPNP